MAQATPCLIGQIVTRKKHWMPSINSTAQSHTCIHGAQVHNQERITDRVHPRACTPLTDS